MKDFKKRLSDLRKFSSDVEKKCNKCGFATFCLRVLYKHKHKCKGQLLGSLKCCWCKRKFNYFVLYRQHKKTCVQYHENKTKMRSILSEKIKNKILVDVSSKESYNCLVCEKTFTDKVVFNKHLQKSSCSKKSFKKQSFSARKSFSKPQKRKFECNDSSDEYSYSQGKFSNKLSKKVKFPEEYSTESDSEFTCVWCKNVYPSEFILLKHLERNRHCAKAHHRLNSRSKVSHTARKSIKNPVARKSFSRLNYKHSSPKGSARKSFPNSSHSKEKTNSPIKSKNKCPVCLKGFSDSFSFFQHQKKFSHWGKATKSIGSTCRCPFCSKEFFHVRARNAHVRNHADKSKDEIELFIKNSTCNVCAEIFLTEAAKNQHMRITHSNTLLNPISKDGRNFSLPIVIKQKLKEFPNTCPVCSKEFPLPDNRDDHFHKKHLGSKPECKLCSIKFKNVDMFESHMKNHSDNTKFECVLCNTRLATAPEVMHHINKVHPGKNSRSIIRNRMNKDRQDQATNKNGYFCDVCNISFLKLCGLQSHKMSKSHRDLMTKKHNKTDSNVISSSSTAKKKVPPPEILTCRECQEEFSSVKDFVPHRLSHFSIQSKYLKIGEDNLYVCEICGDSSDTHSKVQMHLFWHLQVESTASDAQAKMKSETVVLDRLSGQLMAKKSFAKSTDPQQEIVIGGVKKPIFTCELCNIGFTTLIHYSRHVRKSCRMKNSQNDSNSEVQIGLPSMDSLAKSLNDPMNINHCTLCNCLIAGSARDIHDSICEGTLEKSTDVFSVNVSKLKSQISNDGVIAACIACNLTFVNDQSYSEHMLECHKKDDSASSQSSDKASEHMLDNSDKASSTSLCTSCNCLFFSTKVIANHDSFCNNFSYCDFDADSVADILKASNQFKDPVAACISCSVMFENAQCLIEHMTLLHQQKSDSIPKESSCTDGASPGNSQQKEIEGSTGSLVKEINNVSTDSNLSLDMLSDGMQAENGEHKPTVLDFAENSLNLSSLDSDEAVMETSKSDHSSSDVSKLQENDSFDDPINKLRENFSQLLCILINDADLMEQLGYGQYPVDDVLVNVLQQMGHTPVIKTDQLLEIDCLRQNIQILLDVSLKDQIMELIGEGQTSTDDIVVEALKMFRSEDLNAVAAAD